jgi:hypothetical protein
MRWVEHVARMGRDAYNIFMGKPEEKGLLRILKCRWEYNIKMT